MSMIGTLCRVPQPVIDQLEADPEAIESVLAEQPDAIDLDKAWHGLHFLFCGDAWSGSPPLDFLVSGGEQVGDIDVGYGPARSFSSAEVIRIHEALAALTGDELRRRFDPAAMTAADIYPSIWDRDPADDDTLGYLLEYFEILRRYLQQAVEERQGLIVYLS